MDVKHASAIVALRPVIERLIVRASENPESVLDLIRTNWTFMELLKDLCNFNCGRHNLPQITFNQGYILGNIFCLSFLSKKIIFFFYTQWIFSQKTAV